LDDKEKLQFAMEELYSIYLISDFNSSTEDRSLAALKKLGYFPFEEG
jgi:hypothetical protein